MTESEKTIARVQTILQKKQSDLISKLVDAEGNYNDTGYERYYNQKERILKQIDELDTYIKANQYLREAEQEIKDFKAVLDGHEKYLRDYMKRAPLGGLERDTIERCLSDLTSRKTLHRLM